MSKSENTDEQRKDPADALASMANDQHDQTAAAPDSPEDEEVDATAALDEMAGDQGDAAELLDDLAEEEAEAVEEEVAAAAGASDLQSRQQGGRTSARHARAHVHAYKKTMIPLLLVVAAILAVVGALATSMLIRAGQTARQTQWEAWLTFVALVSFPLAAILLFGAWLFHREVKR